MDQQCRKKIGGVHCSGDIETLKASRGVVFGDTRRSGEHRELPQLGPGRAPAANPLSALLSITERFR